MVREGFCRLRALGSGTVTSLTASNRGFSASAVISMILVAAFTYLLAKFSGLKGSSPTRAS
jgi:hypothetical protein